MSSQTDAVAVGSGLNDVDYKPRDSRDSRATFLRRWNPHTGSLDPLGLQRGPHPLTDAVMQAATRRASEIGNAFGFMAVLFRSGVTVP
jgi:hypothetical protein